MHQNGSDGNVAVFVGADKLIKINSKLHKEKRGKFNIFVAMQLLAVLPQLEPMFLEKKQV
jgi:hypothetical protein